MDRVGKRKIEDEEKCENKRIQSMKEDLNIEESNSSEEENVPSDEENENYSTGEENGIFSTEEENNFSEEENDSIEKDNDLSEELKEVESGGEGVERKDLFLDEEEKEREHNLKKFLDQEKQINDLKSMKVKGDKLKANLTKRIADLEKKMNEEMSMKEKAKRENEGLSKRISELVKQLNDEKSIREAANKEKDDLKERNLELEKEKNDEIYMKNKYEKEKDDILDFLEREVTCPVCLMIPRTKRIPICRNGHTTCETCKRTDCPVCRTSMSSCNMFSPLTQNITELLEISCMFLDKGCTMKLKKNEMLEHEKEECRYRELMCPGCREKIQACKLPDHFVNCPRVNYKETWQHVELEETRTMHPACSRIASDRPRVFKLTNSKNWFLLCADVLDDKLVFYMKHYSGEKSKEKFNFNLKISDKGKKQSRSLSGVQCTPFDMEVNDSRRKGFTLDISVEAMENMCYLPNTDDIYKYIWSTEISLFKSYP